jgi:integrase
MLAISDDLYSPSNNRNRTTNDALTREQVKRILAVIDNDRDRLLIELGLHTGCRVNELTTLVPNNIDLGAGTIRVWDQKKDTRNGKDRPDKRYRVVDVPADLLEKILLYQENLKNKKRDSLFGQTYKTYERVIQKWSKAALGFKKSWHCLRHTYATQSLNMGRSIEYVARQMGDKEEMVARVYHQLSPEQIAKERAIDIYK